VTVLLDYRGIEIRLTEERLAHMRDVHPEIMANEGFIAETLADPDLVVQSGSDVAAHLYYRRYQVANLGEKHMCVLVQTTVESPFVLTAYLTDRVKKGEVLWERE
jgi:hypothetical protein